MSNNKNEQDTTSKPNEVLNVTPVDSTEKPTSTDKVSDMSSSGDNSQAAVQKQVELRQKAEQEAEKLRLEKQEAETARQKAEELLRTERESRIKSTLENRIQNSNLPQTVKDRFVKDPIKFFIANQTEDKSWTWDDVANQVNNVDSLNMWMKDIEGTYGTQNFNQPQTKKDIFVDSDKPVDRSPSDGQLTLERIKAMSPYEISRLPKDVRDKIKESGPIPE